MPRPEFTRQHGVAFGVRDGQSDEGVPAALDLRPHGEGKADDPERHQDQDQRLVERCEAAQAGDLPATRDLENNRPALMLSGLVLDHRPTGRRPASYEVNASGAR